MSVALPAHFETERLPHRVVSRQPLGSRLQQRTSSDLDSRTEVSAHGNHAFCCLCLNSPVPGVLERAPSVSPQSRNHPVRQTRFLVYLQSTSSSSSLLALLRLIVAEKEIFHVLSWQPAKRGLQDLPRSLPSLYFFLNMNPMSNASALNRET